MLHALALAFNKSGGSFQCNIDGTLAVRVIQGFVSQNGIICAQLAKRGITGPENFIEGIYKLGLSEDDYLLPAYISLAKMNWGWIKANKDSYTDEFIKYIENKVGKKI